MASTFITIYICVCMRVCLVVVFVNLLREVSVHL